MRPPTSSLRAPLAASTPLRALARQPRPALTVAASRRAYSQAGEGLRRSNDSRRMQLLSVAAVSGFIAWNYDNILDTFGIGADEDDDDEPKEEKKERVAKKQKKKGGAGVKKVETVVDQREHDAESIEFYRTQVAENLKKPGLYVWGSNKGLVAAPDSPRDTFIKRPKRIPFFDGMVLRDVKLAEDFGVAVTEAGDLVQWGRAFGKDDDVKPEFTFQGLDIAKVEVSMDRIIALSSDGTVYSIPVAKYDQLNGPKVTDKASSSWIPYWSSPIARSLRLFKPPLGLTERVVDIKSGLEHCLLLTSGGRVFSAASSSSYFPDKGQLGVEGLTWETRPAGAYDQLYEVKFPAAASKIKQIAVGDFHSVALDKKGNVYGFGDNMFGQLGREVDRDRGPQYDSAIRIYQIPPVASIVAGGSNTFFTIVGQNVSGNDRNESVSEIWASGLGVAGSLGTGGRQHQTSQPVKVKKLSNLSEWDEHKGAPAPIKPARVSVGAHHSAVVMRADTGTQDAWPVYMWGGNDNYELGNGKRLTSEEPIRVPPLEGEVKAGWGEVFLAVAPRKKATVGDGREAVRRTVEQRVECGRDTTAAYIGV